VTSRKPAFLRWAEEAEAKEVCLLAGLEREAPRAEASRDVHVPPPSCSSPRVSLLNRLRGLFGSQPCKSRETVNDKTVYHERH
jgi:hypothetical protein